jgi:hypothetical protein
VLFAIQRADNDSPEMAFLENWEALVPRRMRCYVAPNYTTARTPR